jgi:serine protease inhibitor
MEDKENKIDSKEKNNKNSVILIFAVLGGLIFMLLVIISLVFLVPLINGKKDTTKTEVDADKVYSTYRMTGNTLDKFDIAFLKFENNGKNKVYSPISIKYALAMLSEGSADNSKNQINKLIGDYKSNKYINNDHMSFANAIFIRNTFKDNVKEEYRNNLKSKYNAEVIFDDFKDASNMNKWVNDKTFGLINDLFGNEVKEENFELTNALAIDMKWNNQIQCATGSDVPCIRYNVHYAHEKIKGQDYQYSDGVYYINRDDDYHALTFDGKENIKSVEVKAAFNRYDAVKEIGEAKIIEEVGNAYKEWLETEDGKNNVKYGYAETNVDKYLAKYIEELKGNYGREDYSTDFMIYNDENIKAFAKDLKESDGTTLQYIGIMPKNESLKEYVNKLEVSDINSIISGLKEMKKENFKDGVLTLVKGYIPVFNYEYTLNLKDDLKEMGITDVFDAKKANLSSMLDKSDGQFISSATHKAKIEFSNDGIKAAAATKEGGTGAVGGGFNYLYEVPVEEIDITFDKPFIYLIRDKATGEVWFMGSVYEPKTK